MELIKGISNSRALNKHYRKTPKDLKSLTKANWMLRKKNAEDEEVKAPKRQSKIKKVISDDIEGKRSIKREEVTLALKTIFDSNEELNESKQEVNKFNIQLYIYNLQIPECPSRTIRIPIPHGIAPEGATMCLIAHDVKKDGKFDEDSTISYYTDLLRSKNVIDIPVVIPMHTLKTKYCNFELKRQLMNQYDILLVDVRVSGFAYHLIGKTLEKKNKCLTPIKLESPELIKSEMKQALRKTKIALNSKADTSSVQVGHSEMRIEDIAQNTLEIIKWIVYHYPGGWTNIRALSLKADHSPPVPLFKSSVDRDAITAPFIVNNKRKLVKTRKEVYLSEKGEQIRVQKGRVVVVKKNAVKKKIKRNKESAANITSSEEDSDTESILKIYD